MSSLAEYSPGVPEYTEEHPHVLTVVNPGSSRYIAALEQARLLMSEGFMEWTDLIETSMDRYETWEKIDDKLTASKAPYDAVVCLTGDGGANDVASYLLGKETPLLFGGFGGINDGKIITTGKNKDISVAKQPIIPIYPIETAISCPEAGKTKRIGLFYKGIGYTALAAELVNKPPHRGSWTLNYKPTKKAREGMTVAKALMRAEPFYVEDMLEGKSIPGSGRELYEYLLSNGPRMAGMPIYPGDPTASSLKKVELATKPAVISELAKLAIIRYKGDWAEIPAASLLITTEDDGHTVPLQFDGETLRLSNRTKLDIAPSAKPLYIVAPALKATER